MLVGSAIGDANVLDYPAQNALTQQLRDTAEKKGNAEYMLMWAGQMAAACQACSAADLIQQCLDKMD